MAIDSNEISDKFEICSDEGDFGVFQNNRSF